MASHDQPDGTARYVFRVDFRLASEGDGVSVSPAQFETKLYRTADEPRTEGWLFFRDNLWRGELGDSAHFRTLAEDALGVTVTSVSFSELQTDEVYLDALRDAIGENLDAFKASSVEETLSKYLGSSIRVRSDGT